MNEERYHETLGLRPGATREELKTAYRDMAKVWHPDRFAHDPRLQSMAQEKLKEINEAYKQLTSPRPSRARRPSYESHTAHADATRNARTRYDSPPPVVVVRETRARRSSLPVVATIIIVAAVTFFAATRVFTNRPGATADAAAAQPSTVAPDGRDSAELSSAADAKDRKAAARQKTSEADAGAFDAPAAQYRALPTVTRAVDPTTGLLATRACPVRTLMTYPAGSEPQGSCTADHAPKSSPTRAAQGPQTQDAQTAAGASAPAESKEKSRLKSVVGTLASPGKWFKKKKEKPASQ